MCEIILPGTPESAIGKPFQHAALDESVGSAELKEATEAEL